MELLSVAVFSDSIQLAWKVAIILYRLLQSGKPASKHVRDLHARVLEYSTLCETTAKHVQNLGGSTDRDELQLRKGIEDILENCNDEISQLKDRLEGTQNDNTNRIAQAYRRIRLDLNEEDIQKSKDQIENHVSKLSHYLLLLMHRDLRPSANGTPGWISTANATGTREWTTTVKQQSSIDISRWESSEKGRVVERSDIYSTYCPTEYEPSLNGSTIFGDEDFERLSIKPDHFISHKPSKLFNDAPRVKRKDGWETGSFAGTSHAQRLDERTLDPEKKEQDPTTRAAREALAVGFAQFQSGAFAEAQESLRRGLWATDEIQRRYPLKHVSLAGVAYRLAVCAFQLHDVVTAELALYNIFARQSGPYFDALECCHAGYLLALTCARTNRVELAASISESVYWKTRTIFLDKDHSTCLESMVLLAICYELLKHPVQAQSCMELVPPAMHSGLRYQISLSLYFPRRQAIKETTISQSVRTPCRLSWSADNKLLGWQESNNAISVYDNVSGRTFTVSTDESRPIKTFALASSDCRLVVASTVIGKVFRDQQVMGVYDIKSNKCVYESKLKQVQSAIAKASFLRDDTLIACTDEIRTTSFCRFSSEQMLQPTTPIIKVRDQHGAPRFSSNGKMIAVAHRAGFNIYNATSGELAQYVGHDIDQMTVSWAYSPDGSMLALVVGIDKVLLIDLPRGGVKSHIDLPCVTYATISSDEQDIAFIPGGRLILARYVSSGPDRALTVYDVRLGIPYVLDKDELGFDNLAFSRDGTYLAATAKSRPFIKIWDVAKVVHHL